MDATINGDVPVAIVDSNRSLCKIVVPKSTVELANAKLVNPDIVPPVIVTSFESCTDNVPSPKFVLAADAVIAPVPPAVIAIGVPSHSPVEIVPRVIIEV